MEGLYRVGTEDRGKAAAALVDAFGAEIEILCRKFAIERSKAESFFSVPLLLGFSRGEVYASSPLMEGIMTIMPGERSDFGLPSVIASGALRHALAALKLMGNREVRATFARLSRDKKGLDIGPYIYLAVLGIATGHQGKGVGGRMLASLCDRADAEGKALYLETQNEENVAWYGRYGFATRKKLGSPETIELWEMVRARR